MIAKYYRRQTRDKERVCATLSVHFFYRSANALESRLVRIMICEYSCR